MRSDPIPLSVSVSHVKRHERAADIGRYPVNVRYARGLRDNLSQLRRVLVPTASGTQVPISQLASITLRTGPPMIKNEEGFLAGFVYVDVTGRDMGRYGTICKDRVRFRLAPVRRGEHRGRRFPVESSGEAKIRRSSQMIL